MRALLVLVCFSVGQIATQLAAQDPSTIELSFATKAEASALLAVEDDFVQRMSPFDRSARLKTDQPVDRAAYLKFVGEQTLDWSEPEQENLRATWSRVLAGLGGTKFNAPKKVTLIKTTGLEEGDAAYTRGTSIILPKSKVTGRGNDALMAHELFHVLSRHDAAMRERLYQLIGFRRCGELTLPTDLQARRLTNPDAPINDHCIEVKLDGKPVWVVPILTSKAEKYDLQRGGEFFNYLQFELMVIENPDQQPATQPLLVDGQPVRLDARKADGFLEQIGKNTAYIIHPDEILADNFSMLITQRKNVPQPELLEKINKALQVAP